MINEKRNITPEQAIKILQKHGTNVTVEEVRKILDFLYKLGKLSVDQYVKIQ